jgi:hypothetical protein
VAESVKPNESMDMDLKVIGAYLINHKYMHTFIPCDNEQLLWIYDISQNGTFRLLNKEFYLYYSY